MLLYNENHERINASKLKQELATVDSKNAPTREELENELAQYYHRALSADLNSLNLQVSQLSLQDRNVALSLTGIGGGILEKIRKFLCSVLHTGSTTSEIIDAVLQAVATIIPGGIIVKAIVERLVKYILSIGIGRLCPA